LKGKLKWIFVVLVVGFALLQLTNPPRTNPPVVSDLMVANAPPPLLTNYSFIARSLALSLALKPVIPRIN